MMPDNNPTPPGYAQAAEVYWQAGWRGILPLRRGFKKTPPKNFTGKTGGYPSYPDIMQWADLYPDGNLCLRLPPDIVGIDVDAYGAKTGAAALAEAEKRWGTLPPTVRSTSREDGVSGIRLYRIPDGVQLAEGIEFPDLGVGDIEICQRRHRYVLAWPSIHPEGRGYWWRSHADQYVGVPNLDDIPDLPENWITHLTQKTQAPDLTGDLYPIRAALTGGEPSAKVVDRLRQAIRELNLSGHSRHDTTRGHVMALLRLGKTGESGVERALTALGEMFIALVTPDRPGGKDEATREYKTMVTGDGAARQLAQPSLTDWVRAIMVEEPEPEPLPAAEQADGPAEPYSHLEDIERGFWDSRESLQSIWTTAMSRMSSPWAVLAHCAARALTQVRPCITLPPLIGGPGSLNWFAAITAASGGGKGSAGAAARLLTPAEIHQHHLGSGEGLVALYAGDRKDPDSGCEAIFFTADEIDTITALGSRSGSTMMATLRSAFSGEPLGFSYADKDKRRYVPAHTYRMTLVISVQPERAAGLIGDAGGGTPQRFMWFPGTDNRITAQPPWEAGPLRLPSLGEWQYPRELAIPDEARALILDERVKLMRGQSDALDGHALFVREKFAFALAILDGRTDMTLEDWELSGIAADISTFTRELVRDTLRGAADRDAAVRGAVRGIELEAADVERDYQKAQRAQRVLRWLLAKLDDAAPDGLSNRELHRTITSRDRSMLEIAIQVAVADGLITQVEGTTKWVKR